MWREILALLATLSADPVQIETEHPRAAAAVSVARASMARQGPTPPPQPPQPDDGDCCSDCNGTGEIVHPDGHRTECPCPASCDCKQPKQPTVPAKPADPPLVRVPQVNNQRPGRIVCSGGTCYWVDSQSGQRYRVINGSSASPARAARSR